jgi:nucleotide-binding universal stress UspA family protein
VFATVMVPLDGSMLADNALDAGAAIARACAARLLVVRVVGPGEDEAEAAELVRDETARLTDVPVDVACPTGRDVAEVLADVVAEVVAETAEERPGVLVCMSTHGRGGVGRALLGSVAEGIVQRGVAPLLLVGPNADIGALPLVGRVAVCLDGSEGAEAALPLARRWAETFEMDLELVRVVAPGSSGSSGSGTAEADATSLDGIADSLRREGFDVEQTVLRGLRPAAAIVDHVVRRRPALIALATRGRTGLARVALGSVTMDVVQHSPRPVLVIPPLE